MDPNNCPGCDDAPRNPSDPSGYCPDCRLIVDVDGADDLLPTDYGHGLRCTCGECCRQASQDLLMTASGTYKQVDFAIADEVVRRPGYRLSVAGNYIATFDSRPEALKLAKDYINELHEQGLVGSAQHA